MTRTYPINESCINVILSAAKNLRSFGAWRTTEILRSAQGDSLGDC